MGYHVIDAASVDPTPDRPCVQRRLGARAGLEQVGLNLYEAQPGEQLPLAYHFHDTQEEGLFVLSGALHVETPERTYVVEANELFTAEPESPHRAFVPEEAAGPARVLALGAPLVDGDAHVYEP